MYILRSGQLLEDFSKLASFVIYISLPQRVAVAALEYGPMVRGRHVLQQGKEAEAGPPFSLLGTQVLRMDKRYLHTAHSWCVQDMSTYTRGVWAGVPPYSAHVSSLGEIKLVFLCGNPSTHTYYKRVCLIHNWNSVIRGLIVTCIGRASRYVVSPLSDLQKSHLPFHHTCSLA